MFARKYYNRFPPLKAQCGLVLDHGEKSYSFRYTWFPDVPEARDYLWHCNCENATRIFIGWKNKWYPIKDFMYFVNNKKEALYDELKDKALAAIK